MALEERDTGRSRLVMSWASRGRGSCSVLCQQCCCTGQDVRVPLGEKSLRDVLINSRREDGQSSSIRLDKPQQKSPGRRPIFDEAEDQRRGGNAAQSHVQHGQVSRARHELTGARLAPKTEETRAELQRTRPQEQRRQISPNNLECRPEVPLGLDKEPFITALRSSPPGSAPGPGGCTNEMLRVCLDDAHVFDLLHLAAEDFARGETPASRSFLRATMTASSKKDGGIRGIATGSSFRGLVGKTLARQFGAVVEKICAPFQFALSTRAGTDCVGHAIRVMTDLDARATVLSVDGVGAYDHVLRSSMLGKLTEVPQLRPLIPFGKSTCAHPTSYEWEDQHGTRHQVWQHDGGEQGDHSCLCSSVWRSTTHSPTYRAVETRGTRFHILG